jgi:hypothetical protein
MKNFKKITLKLILFFLFVQLSLAEKNEFEVMSIDDSIKEIQIQGLTSKNLDQLFKSISSEGYGNILENQSKTNISVVGNKLSSIKKELIQTSLHMSDDDKMLHAKATGMLRWFVPDKEITQALFKNIEQGRGRFAMSAALYPIFYYDLDTPELRENLLDRIKTDQNMLISLSNQIRYKVYDFPEMGLYEAKDFINLYTEEEPFNSRHFRSFFRFGTHFGELFYEFEKIHKSLQERSDVSEYNKTWFKKFLFQIPVNGNPYFLIDEEKLLLKAKTSTEKSIISTKENQKINQQKSGLKDLAEETPVSENGTSKSYYLFILLGIFFVSGICLKLFKSKFSS